MSLTINRISIALAIFALLSALSPVSPLALLSLKIPYLDKLAHFGANFLFTLLLSQYFTIRKSILITFLIFTGVECYQYIMPRDADIKDIIANTGGIICAWAVYKLRLTFFSK